MLEINKKSDNPFVHHYPIEGIDQDRLHYVEIVDHIDTGRSKWFLTDCLDNTTPIFDNDSDIILLTPNSCIFVGETNGKSELYYAQGPIENEAMYWTIDLSVEPKSITRYNNNYVIINSNDGQFFFNKSLLEQSSDIFDAIKPEEVEGKKIITFEKSIRYENLVKKITGMVSPNGKIEDIMYDDIDGCLKTTPKISSNRGHDVLDIIRLHEGLEKYYNKKKKEMEENIKKLARVNGNRKNDK